MRVEVRGAGGDAESRPLASRHPSRRVAAGRNVNDDRSLEKRSVTNAIVRPSCDHAGCRSANGIVGQAAAAAGDVAHVEIGKASRERREGNRPSVGRPRRRQDLADAIEHDLAIAAPAGMSISISAALPWRTAANANHCRPGSRRRPIAAVAGCRTSRSPRSWRACESRGRSRHRRGTDRATRRSRSEKNTACVPSGLSDGPSCMCSRLHASSGRAPRARCRTPVDLDAPSRRRALRGPRRWRNRIRSFNRRCFLPGFSAFSITSSPKRSPDTPRRRGRRDTARVRARPRLFRAADRSTRRRAATGTIRCRASRATGIRPCPR